MRDHRKLEAFQLADSFVEQIYRTTANFPDDDKNNKGLTVQLRGASVSGVANIVEGAAKQSPKEFCRFLRIAFASRREAQYLVNLSKRVGYLDAKTHERLKKLNDRATGALVELLKTAEEWKN
jgi:four helix bundle protein